MLTTTHLRRERPIYSEDNATAASAFASGSVRGAGAAGGSGRKGLQGVVGVGGGHIGGSVDSDARGGEGSDVFTSGACLGATGGANGSVAGMRGFGGTKVAVSPLSPLLSAAASAAHCDSRGSENRSSGSNNTAYSSANSILTDSRMWLAHFER